MSEYSKVRKKKEVFKLLDSLMPESSRIKLLSQTKDSDDFVSATHFNLGLWIRNTWVYKDDKHAKEVRKLFVKEEYIHPDDISSMILSEYYNYLTGRL